MQNIDEIWPDVTPQDIAIYITREKFQWLVLSRMYQQGISEQKEISEADLIQGVPAHVRGRMSDAAKVLNREGVLFKQPKRNVDVYKVNISDPFFENENARRILRAIRENANLKSSIIEDTVNWRITLRPRIDPTIEKVINNTLQGRRGDTINKYELNISENKSALTEGDFYYPQLSIEYLCPNKRKPIPIEWLIESPCLFETYRSIVCPHCGINHQICPGGNIF